MTNLIDLARDRVQSIHAELDDALREGGDTAGIRTRLELAQSEVSRLEAVAVSERESRLIEDQRAAEAAAVALTDEAIAGIVERLKALTEQRPIPKPTGLPGIAYLLVQARKASELERARTSAHQAELAELEQRIRALDDAKAHIAQRRLHGDTREGDASEVALIDLDRNAIADLRARTAAHFDPAPQQRAERDVHECSATYRRALVDAELAAYSSIIRDLQARLTFASNQHRALALQHGLL